MKKYTLEIDNKNITLILGENAKENHELISASDQNDWWFHLNSFPSGHCVVETNELNKELIYYAANIVKENSKYKNLKNIKIVYLQIKFIKKTKNPGEVELLKKGNYISL